MVTGLKAVVSFRDEVEPPPNVLVISHAHCTDGFCAAWIARKVYPAAHFHFSQYAEQPPEVAGREVYVLDFSFSRNILLALRSQARSLTVLDHHKTAAADLKGLPGCHFDMDRSGAGVTWQFFSRLLGRRPPWLVRYVQDRDLLRHSLPNSRAVNAVIASYPFDFDRWDELADRPLPDVAREGRSILRYQRQVADDLVHYAREVDFDGHKVLAVNTSMMNNDVGELLASGRPFGVVWFQREDGKYVYSLRSRKGGLDVSVVAKRHGGGGHRFSSGFVSEQQLV